MRRLAGQWLILLAGFALAACGYSLQGSEQLPPVMRVTYIQAQNPYSDLSLALERALRAAGMQTTRTPAGASAILRLNVDQSGQRLLSVSATNVPQEFEVYYTAAYELLADDRVLLSVPQRTLTRDYTFDPTDVLAKRREEELLRRALADDLVRLIMRRLAAVQVPPAG